MHLLENRAAAEWETVLGEWLRYHVRDVAAEVLGEAGAATSTLL